MSNVRQPIPTDLQSAFRRVRLAWDNMSESDRANALRRLAALGQHRPPPPATYALEAFHEHPLYSDMIGDGVLERCTFGYEWETKPTTLYSTFDDASGDYSNKTISGTEWGCWGTTGLGHACLNLYGPIQKNITFRDCAWLAADNPFTDAPSWMRWGLRGFAMMNVGFYDCAFSRGMGAGTQVALRASAAGGHITPRGVHRYQECKYIGNGDPKSERFGAFTLSEHPPEGYDFDIADIEVLILDCTLLGGHLNYVDGNGILARSSRGIMANGRKRVAIERLHMDYPAPLSGWAIQLWDDPEALIADSYVHEGLVELVNPQKVDITGNKGNAILRVWTGRTRDAFGNWKGGQMIHDEPLSAGFQMGR